MYESFFGLTEAPFSIAPNPHYLYMSRQHHEALAHLVFAVGREGGFVLLTGEVGTGKTTICRCFLEQIPTDTDVAFVLHPKLDSEQLLASICDELGISHIKDSLSIKDYVDFINERLLSAHAKGRHTVLIIDEAQNLSAEVLEQLRLLTNLETHEKKLLQVVLLGQPELQTLFHQPELRQLSQRVTARFHLDALTREETQAYVTHRLAVAGCRNPEGVFPAATIKRLHRISKGIPRVINLICDRALLGAYTQSRYSVDVGTLTTAAREVLGDRHKPRSTWNWRETVNLPFLVQGVMLSALVGLGVYWGVRMATPTVNLAQPAVVATSPTPPPIAAQALNQPPPSLQQNIATVDDVVPLPLITNTTPVPEPTPEPAPVEQEPAIKDDTITLESAGVETPLMSLTELLNRPEIDASEANAYHTLMKVWGVEYQTSEHGLACRHAEANGLACLNRQGSVGSLRHVGLPAILTMLMSDGSKQFVVLRYLSDHSATLLVEGEQYDVDITSLDAHWRGAFVVLWRVPEHYHGPVQPGTIGPISRWLITRLNAVEGVPDTEPVRAIYTEEVAERVKRLQRHVGEVPDGIVGVNTLIQLSRLTDAQLPRLEPGGEAM